MAARAFQTVGIHVIYRDDGTDLNHLGDICLLECDLRTVPYF